MEDGSSKTRRSEQEEERSEQEEETDIHRLRRFSQILSREAQSVKSAISVDRNRLRSCHGSATPSVGISSNGPWDLQLSRAVEPFQGSRSSSCR
jgi:hypothetical protein